MGYIKFANLSNVMLGQAVKQSNNIIKLIGVNGLNTSGFIYYNDSAMTKIICDCSLFTTVYKQENDGASYSNNGSTPESIAEKEAAASLPTVDEKIEAVDIRVEEATNDLEVKLSEISTVVMEFMNFYFEVNPE